MDPNLGPFSNCPEMSDFVQQFTCGVVREGVIWESARVSHKRVLALLTPEIPQLEMARVLQKPVFALPGCQRMSVNTLLCDTLGLADHCRTFSANFREISANFPQNFRTLS